MPVKPLTTLLRDRRGMVSIYFTVVMTAMVLLMVAAIDLLRVGLVRSRAQAALDSAVLAVGANLAADEDVWQKDGQAYFAANMGSNAMGATIDGPVITSATNNNVTLVTITADVSVPLMITAFVDASAFKMSMRTVARQQTKANLEMVLAMDNTGSMDRDNKMTEARKAAKSMVTTMLGASGGGNNYIGLVPFTETVRLPAQTEVAAWRTSESNYNWSGCLFERQDSSGNVSVDVRPPTDQLFRGYRDSVYWEYELKNKRHNNNDEDCSDSNEKCEYVGPNYKELTSQNGCNGQARAVFLTAAADTLNTAIDNMNANGSTMVASGLMWGWRMLAPSWRGQWDAGSSLPRNTGAGINKVLVLLTDGDNEVFGYDQPYNDGKYYFFSSYGDARHVKPWDNITGKNNANADNLVWSNDASILNYCDEIRNDGITIFTIPFGPEGSISTTTEALLKGCAAHSATNERYFRVTESTDLKEKFDKILSTFSELTVIE